MGEIKKTIGNCIKSLNIITSEDKSYYNYQQDFSYALNKFRKDLQKSVNANTFLYKNILAPNSATIIFESEEICGSNIISIKINFI